jgi:hypothetical protein
MKGFGSLGLGSLNLLSVALTVWACSSENPAPPAQEPDATTDRRAGEKDAAEEVAREWLSLMDAGDYERAWEEADSLIRDAIAKEEFRLMSADERGSLGEILSREVRSRAYRTNLPNAPAGEYVLIEFVSSFENADSMTETVTPRLNQNGEWLVAGYYIN